MMKDHVSEAYRVYRAQGGTLTFPEWHDKYAPPHHVCNFCLGVAR